MNIKNLLLYCLLLKSVLCKLFLLLLIYISFDIKDIHKVYKKGYKMKKKNDTVKSRCRHISGIARIAPFLNNQTLRR